MIRYHLSSNGIKIAEIQPGSDLIANPDEMLDIMVRAGYMDCSRLVISAETLHKDFFDLKTGLAGEILQKYSNYRMRLAIIGDFTHFRSKSLKDFMRESNNRGVICFVKTLDEALVRLNK